MQTQFAFDPTYQCRFEEPNLLFVKVRGEIDVAAINWYLDQIDEVIAAHGSIYILHDMTEAKGLTTAARRAVAHHKIPEVQQWVFFGTSFFMQPLVMMTAKALTLIAKLSRRKNNYSVFPTEQAARDYIKEHSAKRCAPARP